MYIRNMKYKPHVLLPKICPKCQSTNVRWTAPAIPHPQSYDVHKFYLKLPPVYYMCMDCNFTWLGVKAK